MKKEIYKSNGILILLIELNKIKSYSIYVNGSCESKNISKVYFDKILKEIDYKSIINNNSSDILNKLIESYEESLLSGLSLDIGDNNKKENTEINGHLEILTKPMLEMFDYLENFKDNYFLAGGTAVALLLGHRESVDWDLFTNDRIIDNFEIEKITRETGFKLTGTSKNKGPIFTVDENHFILNNVDVTLSNFSRRIHEDEKTLIPANIKIKGFPIFVPDLKTLGAMKLFAMTSRDKNKDYYDLYFILKHFEIIELLELAFDLFSPYIKINNAFENLEAEGFQQNEKINWKIPLSEVPKESEIKGILRKEFKKIADYLIKNPKKGLHFQHPNFDFNDGGLTFFEKIKAKFLNK